MSAFTLIELLLVLGIILILIGILIPTISKIRISVQAVSTRQMISRLENGINAYYSDFHAYPGPLSNAQLLADAGGATASAGAIALGIPRTTSSENLFLGLSGGLEMTAAGTPPQVATFNYNQTLAANNTGPGNINPSIVKRYTPYMIVTPEESTLTVKNNHQPSNAPGQWSAANGQIIGDTIVPEYVDKFANPSPILYLRAASGAAAMTNYVPLTVGITYTGNGTNAPQDTDWTNITAPTNPNAAIVTNYPQVVYSGSPVLAAGWPAYIGNNTLASGSGTAVSANKDTFVLISAGPDGVYGTSDDITNFRN